MKKILACLVIASVFVGCASTPYQSSGITGGFSELKIKDDVWRVRFAGNGFTTRESVQTYWLYRSAEIALDKGYDGFEILSPVLLSLPNPPQSGYIKTAGMVFVPLPSNSSSHPVIAGDILLIKKPFTVAPPQVFDAAELKTTLEPYIQGKKCGDLTNTTGNVCPHMHDYLYPKGKFDKPAL